MALAGPIIAELKQEAAQTRKALERIPESLFGWKPHPKSFSMGDLASHLANLSEWARVTVVTSELNLDPAKDSVWRAKSSAELLEVFDANLNKALEALNQATDQELMDSWSLKVLGETKLTMPRLACLRNWILNHMIHHRGQLTVYLRLNDIPVPAIYGPSADES